MTQMQNNTRERYTGTVKWFDPTKGYGFIDRDNMDEDIFVHASDILGAGIGGFESLKEGQRVEFEIEQSPRGPKAVLVTVEG